MWLERQQNFTNFSLIFLQVIYAGLTLFQWNDKVKSQSGLGLSGVLLVTLTVAGGLGCCALIDIPFNAITTQVIPVWVVCMGINPIFVMTQTYAEICNSNIPMEVRIFTNVHAKIPKIIFLYHSRLKFLKKSSTVG